MFKLILFHPGIDLKQKLYLIHQYCICFYIDCFMYLVEKYFIELDKSVDEYLKNQKSYKIVKKMIKNIKKAEKTTKKWRKKYLKDLITEDKHGIAYKELINVLQ